MTHVVRTEALLAEGVITSDQAAEIARRSRDTMMALAINTVLTAGIAAATVGLVFWLADAMAVAIAGLLFLGLGAFVLVKGGDLYRMLGHAAALVGSGMLFMGAGIEISDLGPQTAGPILFLAGAGSAALAAWAFRKGPPSLRFTTGTVALMGAALHLWGLGHIVDAMAEPGMVLTLAFGYAAALIAAFGLFLNVRLVTALAIVPFAQMLETDTTYFHAAYVFYSPEPTLTILQMSALIAACLWARANQPDRIGRHAGILAIMAAVVGNLAFLVASLWGDYIGMSFFRDAAPRYDGDWQAYQNLREAWEAQFLHISEHVYTVVWACLLIAAALWSAHTARRGLFNTAMTFGAIHAYTQLFETFSDEPLAYALGGLAAIPLAWGVWRLNQRIGGRLDDGYR